MRQVFCLCLLLALTSGPAWGAAYLVKPDGTGDFPTIQAAVDAAEDGDTIELADGTFVGEGNRDIQCTGKLITLRSQSSDPETCIIDCEGVARAFMGSLGGSLEGVTVTGGFSTNFGGAVNIVDGEWDVYNCIFSGNQAALNGGVIFIDVMASASFTKCSFLSNTSQAGGAICT